MTTETLFDIRHEIVEAGKRMGFRDTMPETLPYRLMCVIAELNELESAMEAGQDSDVEDEIADVAIYIVRILTDICGDDWCLRVPPTWYARMRYMLPMQHTAATRETVVRAFECWRRDNPKDTMIWLELGLNRVQELARRIDVALVPAIRAKIERNKDRPRLNGGKHPDT